MPKSSFFVPNCSVSVQKLDVLQAGKDESSMVHGQEQSQVVPAGNSPHVLEINSRKRKINALATRKSLKQAEQEFYQHDFTNKHEHVLAVNRLHSKYYKPAVKKYLAEGYELSKAKAKASEVAQEAVKKFKTEHPFP